MPLGAHPLVTVRSVCYRQYVNVDERARNDVLLENLPILGEPFAVEFANSLYRLGDGSSIDFLGSAELFDAWFVSAPRVGGEKLAPDSTTIQVSELRQLRGVVIDLLDAVVAKRAVAGSDVSALNAYAARASCRLQLRWNDGQGSAALAYSGAAADKSLASIAGDAISFLASEQPASLRRCERPDCFMMFVQQHHKRRFCSESCSHRTRQARYYRSNSNRPTTMKATQP